MEPQSLANGFYNFMKKLLIALLLFPFPAFAEVPQGVMGFMDGKLYNTSDSSLAYICFMDGNCYDKEMKFAFNRGVVAGAITPTPAPTPTGFVPALIGSSNDAPRPDTIPQPTPTPTPVAKPSVQPTPTPVKSNLLPAYTETEFLKIAYDAYKEHPNIPGKPSLSNYNYWWPISLNLTNTSASFPFKGSYIYQNLKVMFNNEIVSYRDAYGNPIYLTTENLSPDTQYIYKAIYTEQGREDTIFIKPFYTPSN